METKNIGILGSGPVAQALGNGFIKNGYTVMLGSRTPEKLKEWKDTSGSNASTGTFKDAARFGEILVLAVKGNVAGDVLRACGHENLSGKIVIDTTNPIADAPPENGVLKFFTTLDKSLMEELQSEFKDVHFVKAFNSIGSHFMVNPDFGGEKPTMFIAGNNNNAKKKVADIVHLFGLGVADMGGVEAARALEPLCILWCIPGILHNEWSHGFKLLKK